MNPYVGVCHNDTEYGCKGIIWNPSEVIPPAPKTELSRCPVCRKPITWTREENAIPIVPEDMEIPEDGETQTWIQQTLFPAS